MKRKDKKSSATCLAMALSLATVTFGPAAEGTEDFVPIPPPGRLILFDDPPTPVPLPVIAPRRAPAYVPGSIPRSVPRPALPALPALRAHRPSVDLAILNTIIPSATAIQIAANTVQQRRIRVISNNLASGASHPVLQAIKKETSGAEFIRSEFMRQLLRELPGGGDGVIIDEVRMPLNLKIPEGDWDVDFSFSLPQRGTGAAICKATISKLGNPLRLFNISAQVDRMVTGVQVRRLIRRGERIGPDDLVTLDAKLSLLPSDSLTSHATIGPTNARAELRPGAWLTGRMLSVPNAVRNRQPVTLRLSRGSLRIETKGIARENGAIGQVVRVENLGSKRVVFARVISPELVEVNF